jgi:hypothetical protein
MDAHRSWRHLGHAESAGGEVGIRLMVEVLDLAPDDLDAGARLLLVALAEKADDRTRKVIWSRGDDPRTVLRRRLGVTDAGLGKVFIRLAKAKLDPRIPVGTDKHGRPVFAYEGRVAEYQVPVLRADLLDGPLQTEDESTPHRLTSAHPEVSPWSSSGQPVGGSLQAQEVSPQAGPSPSVPEESLDARETPAEHAVAVASLISRHQGLSVGDAIDCVTWVAERRKPDNLGGYVSKFSLDDIRAKAAEHRGRRDELQRCRHGNVDGLGIQGRGENASRICGRCEVDAPAADAEVPLSREEAS